jgi:hypothetical protein
MGHQVASKKCLGMPWNTKKDIDLLRRDKFDPIFRPKM